MLTPSKHLTARELKRERTRLTRELAKDYRQKSAAEVARLRSELRTARRARRDAMSEVRALCRETRREVRARIRAERERARLELNARRDAGLEAAGTVCAKRLAKARAEGDELVKRAERALSERRATARQVRQADARHAAKQGAKRSAAESRAESDDAVRANLPSELVPVFDAVRSRIKAGRRHSRTEAFLHWAEENPGEVLAIQSHQAELEVQRLVREHQAEERRLHKARRRVPREVRERVAAQLADVPF
jgi:hypothetical protein